MLLAEMIESGQEGLYRLSKRPSGGRDLWRKMDGLLVMDTHGGRSYAIEMGDIEIDVAFIATLCATAAATERIFGPGLRLARLRRERYVLRQAQGRRYRLPGRGSRKQANNRRVYRLFQVDRIGRREGIIAVQPHHPRPRGLLIADAAAFWRCGAHDGFSDRRRRNSLAVADRLNAILKKEHLGRFRERRVTEYRQDA